MGSRYLRQLAQAQGELGERAKARCGAEGEFPRGPEPLGGSMSVRIARSMQTTATQRQSVRDTYDMHTALPTHS